MGVDAIAIVAQLWNNRPFESMLRDNLGPTLVLHKFDVKIPFLGLKSLQDSQ